MLGLDTQIKYSSVNNKLTISAPNLSSAFNRYDYAWVNKVEGVLGN